jgi:uncharacterized membrane protein YbhN (UPF0104 family)
MSLVNRKSVVRIIISVGIAGLLVGLLLKLGDPGLIVDYIRTSNLRYVLLGFLFFALGYLARGERLLQFKALQGVKQSDLLPIVALYRFFNLLLPARTGDVILVVLLKKYSEIYVGSSLGILILTRIYDLSALALSFSIGMIWIGLQGRSSGTTRLFIFSLILGILTLVLGLIIRRIWRVLQILLKRILQKFHWNKKAWARAILDAAKEVDVVLQSSRSKTFLVRLFLASFVIWGSLFATYWSLLRSMEFSQYNFPQTVVGSTAASLSNALPVNSFGSLGTLEIGWTAGFSFIGMTLEESVASGFAIHFWLILFTSIWAIISYQYLSVRSRNSEPAEKPESPTKRK